MRCGQAMCGEATAATAALRASALPAALIGGQTKCAWVRYGWARRVAARSFPVRSDKARQMLISALSPSGLSAGFFELRHGMVRCGGARLVRAWWGEADYGLLWSCWPRARRWHGALRGSLPSSRGWTWRAGVSQGVARCRWAGHGQARRATARAAIAAETGS